MLAAGTIGLVTIFFSWLNFRSSRAGDFLEGDPVIVVERGRPIDKNLRRNRITHEELAAQARLQNIAHIENVEWAVLETSGQISFIEKKS